MGIIKAYCWQTGGSSYFSAILSSPGSISRGQNVTFSRRCNDELGLPQSDAMPRAERSIYSAARSRGPIASLTPAIPEIAFYSHLGSFQSLISGHKLARQETTVRDTPMWLVLVERPGSVTCMGQRCAPSSPVACSQCRSEVRVFDAHKQPPPPPPPKKSFKPLSVQFYFGGRRKQFSFKFFFKYCRV